MANLQALAMIAHCAHTIENNNKAIDWLERARERTAAWSIDFHNDATATQGFAEAKHVLNVHFVNVKTEYIDAALNEARLQNRVAMQQIKEWAANL